MSNGALQAKGNGNTTGTFSSFDMDLNVADKGGEDGFRVRRIPTSELLMSVTNIETEKQYKMVLAELCSRFLNPFMNIILAALCTMILLKSSLLRRRASLAPAIAVAAMGITMAAFMSASNMIESLTDFFILAAVQFVVFVIIMFILSKK